MRSACSTTRFAASLDARASSDLPLFLLCFCTLRERVFSRIAGRVGVNKHADDKKEREKEITMRRKAELNFVPLELCKGAQGEGGTGCLLLGLLGRGGSGRGEGV